eukprot:CAMPEP_0115253712 /NCGR_PEP_ID=MMETSP0270-20121206/44814_1 /TAXON_ID=71861 /ORGANISM="Scrippsiella trochoidea, Strain CCMP3099" /LENGTH=217 /DNA_ID=CAMNT_0002669227 /DNA_START=178 /DNA_END=828 /DNA_ORIENTATION=-
MVFHMAACLFYLCSVCSNIILLQPIFFSTWTVHAQLLYLAFSMIGIPIIASALWGVLNRIELNIRLYLYYLMACFVLNSGALVYFFLVDDVCDTVGSFVNLMASSFGEAFLCGAFRIFSYFLCAGGIAVEVYCLWVIWSMCEDVHEGKNGPELWQLIPSKDDIIQKSKRPQDGPYADIVGFAHTQLPGPHPSPYGAIDPESESGIFGGTNHETAYPP